MIRHILLGLCLLGSGRGSSLGAAPEPWADRRLPEKAREGLLLWLDAAQQNAARRALKQPPLAHQDPVAIWYDASGNGRHLEQKNEKARPCWQLLPTAATLRFDGSDDFLIRANLKESSPRATIFLVAAPFSNLGNFRAFAAASPTTKNDYVAGFTIDLGPGGTPRWQTLNVEGIGFGGAVNLLDSAVELGTLHRVCTTLDVGPEEVRLYLDGKLRGKRPRTAATISLEQLVVGARFYSNEARPPYPQGFLDGDIAEVLVYNRVLSDAERQSVESYLAQKYAGVKVIPPTRFPSGGKRLVSVVDPPPVQMFLPGFTVRPLPVNLPNINNVRYRHDGKLIALGYDGNVWILTDTDGDGLEDRARLFWENKGQIRAPIGMALTPPDYKLGQGVFVACKGKVSLLVDTDGDDRADREMVVAQGWKELPHGVDALGVALDRAGNLYFGLGCTDFTNPYQVDRATNKAAYDLHSERGTILKVSADFKDRTILATGIRFPVSLAFNRAGDLFATDQEGATWLPNGNPFDELLHIQPGRHYGFPPRHPRYLPQVIDEPSVVDYAPQHQSTCGLVFNESVQGGPTFGPKRWQGDALVTGYSRGKLYRTCLIKTATGYVAQNQLLACMTLLPVDACVSPQGALVVATHSGMPDWGSGPGGKGKLYRITYDPRAPQPVLIWAAGPQEVRIAFDRPLDPGLLRDLTRQVMLEQGKYVAAGDRFESLRPGYAVVQQQLATPRYDIPVLSASVLPDRRTLTLATGVPRDSSPCALTLPGLGRPEKPGKGELPQHPTIDLAYDLRGIEATWEGADKTSWRGWLPHLDLQVAQVLTRASTDHDRLWEHLKTPGKLTLRTKLDLWHMLQPAIQPGATLDHGYPAEKVTLTLRATSALEVHLPKGVTIQSSTEGKRTATFQVQPKENELVPLEVTVQTGPALSLQLAYHTEEDRRPRPLALARLVLPWVVTKRNEEAVVQVHPALAGGSWNRGRAIFLSPEAACSKCHQVRGEGGKIGPDLSNLIHRDYESVLRDIRFPSVALNPDHLTSLVEMKNGRIYTGVLRSIGPGKVSLGDATGAETILATDQIDSITPAPLSTMPEGLDRVLGPDKLRDLLTFLLVEPLAPARLERADAPPPRTRAEVNAILKGSEKTTKPLRKIHIVLAAGPKDHGPGEHDYPLWQRRWARLFDLAENVRISEAPGWPTPMQWQKADLIVFYSNNPGWTAEHGKEIDAFLARGGGIVSIHYAVDGHGAVPELAERLGLAWKGGVSRFRHGPLDLDFGTARHPIARNFTRLKLVDESYWNLIGASRRIDLLASGVEEGAAQPLLWTRQQGKGRVFVSIPGHYTWTFDDPLFRLLLLRGMAWAAGESVDRFNSLATVGARLQETSARQTGPGMGQ